MVSPDFLPQRVRPSPVPPPRSAADRGTSPDEMTTAALPWLWRRSSLHRHVAIRQEATLARGNRPSSLPPALLHDSALRLPARLLLAADELAVALAQVVAAEEF